MPDKIDDGTETSELFLQAALSNRVVYQGISEAFCKECDIEIPEKRRQSIQGCKLCASCASIEEMIEKRYQNRKPQYTT